MLEKCIAATSDSPSNKSHMSFLIAFTGLQPKTQPFVRKFGIQFVPEGQRTAGDARVGVDPALFLQKTDGGCKIFTWGWGWVASGTIGTWPMQPFCGPSSRNFMSVHQPMLAAGFDHRSENHRSTQSGCFWRTVKPWLT